LHKGRTKSHKALKIVLWALFSLVWCAITWSCISVFIEYSISGRDGYDHLWRETLIITFLPGIMILLLSLVIGFKKISWEKYEKERLKNANNVLDSVYPSNDHDCR